MASQAKARSRFSQANRGVTVGGGGSSGGGSSGGSSISRGYEVIRGGQGMSVRETQPGDIVIKQVGGSSGEGSSGSSSGGGTYYAGSGTYVNAQGQGMSVQQAPAGAKIVQGKDPNIPSSVSISKTQYAKAQAVQQGTPFQFTGAVQESFKGEPEQEIFYKGGRETGRIKYDSSGQAYTETKTPSSFTFERKTPEGKQIREVKFTDEGAELSTAQMIESEVASPILEERQVDTFRPKGTRRDIPITKIFAVDESGKVLREATTEEQKFYRTQATKVLTADSQIKKDMTFLENISSKITGKREKIKGTSGAKTGITQIGLGVASVIVSSAQLIRHPIKSGKEFITYGKDVIKDISVLKTTGKSIGRVIKEEPSFALGVGATLYAGSKVKLPKYTKKAPKITEVPRVYLKGVTQQKKGGIVYTQAGFIQTTAKGKLKIKGIVQAVSEPRRITKEIGSVEGARILRESKITITKARGTTFKQGIKFPSGKIKRVLSKKDIFRAGEIAKVKPRGKFYFTESFGIIKGRKTKTPYVSKGVSRRVTRQGKEYIGQFGATRTPKQKAISYGVFQVLKEQPKKYKISPMKTPKTSLPKQKFYPSEKQIARASVESIVRASSVQRQPKIFAPKIPSAITKVSKTRIYQRTRTPVRTATKTSVRLGILSATRQVMNQKSIQRDLSKLMSRQLMETKQVSKTKQMLRTRQAQRLSSKQIMELTYVPTYVPKTPTKTTTYIPTKPIIPKKPLFFYFKMPSSKDLGISEKQLMGRDVKILAQGFTEKALGLKKLRGI